MKRRTVKRANKKPPSAASAPAGAARPSEPLEDVDLDRVVGGRQTPKTDFGAILGKGAQKSDP